MSESQQVATSIMRASDTARTVLGKLAALVNTDGRRRIGYAPKAGAFVTVAEGQTWDEAVDTLLRNRTEAERAFKQAVAGDRR